MFFNSSLLKNIDSLAALVLKTLNPDFIKLKNLFKKQSLQN